VSIVLGILFAVDFSCCRVYWNGKSGKIMWRWPVVCQVLYNSVCRLLILAASQHTSHLPPVVISVTGADVYNIFFFLVQKFWVVNGVGDLI
jgi:hypothetical protein